MTRDFLGSLDYAGDDNPALAPTKGPNTFFPRRTLISASCGFSLSGVTWGLLHSAIAYRVRSIAPVV